jgi:hypothetical protein
MAATEYALKFVGEDDTPSLVRVDDGATMPLGEANLFVQLKQENPESYQLIIMMAYKLLHAGDMEGLKA